jgi:hypothetical protein
MNKEEQICVLCGKEKATTKDHVPPKGIFPRPRPNDLIKVPACFKCNNFDASNDEIFRVYLSIHVGVDKPSSKALWENHAFKSIKHNRRLQRTLINGMKPVYVRSPSGIFVGKETGVLWDSKAHDTVINRTVRGLYFYHYSEILPPESLIKVNWHQVLTKEMEEMSRGWKEYSIANGDFQYRYGRVEEFPGKSLWLFQFYEKHWASAHTILHEHNKAN